MPFYQNQENVLDESFSSPRNSDCFNRTVEKSPWGTKLGAGSISKYKFYLAFENAIHCNDYISEKFWRNSLGSGVVPIVFGPHPADVAAVAPTYSYIHAVRFKGF